MLAVIADIAGIIGLGLSIWAMLRTASLKKEINDKHKLQHKEVTFAHQREKDLKIVEECSRSFARNNSINTFKDVYSEVPKLLGVISDIERYHPDLSKNDRDNIEELKQYLTKHNEGDHFSFLEIVHLVKALESLLKEEALAYYD